MIKPKLFFNWSSGKDSAFALYKLLESKEYSIDLLVTTIGKETERISLHGLHISVLIEQVRLVGKKLKILELPSSTSMEAYNNLMEVELGKLKNKGYKNCAFGDIFLEDLKVYRENQLFQIGIKPVFPLWKLNTKKLVLDFIELGFKSVIVAANAKWFSKDFVGSTITKELIDNLPEEVDPCGENGEFHTFCYDGPIFSKAVDYKLGNKEVHYYSDPVNTNTQIGFWFCEILLK